jgi:hypothetical protein
MCADQKAMHGEMTSDEKPGRDMHAGMDHGYDSQAMDCCDDAPATSEDHCAAMAHCGACPAGNAAVSPSIAPVMISTAKMNLDFSSDPPLYQSSSPPFRPPIS